MKNVVKGYNPNMYILGVRFDNLTLAETLATIREFLSERRPRIVVTPNMDFLMLARSNPSFREILNQADLSLCDSMPLFWAARWYENPLPARIAGSDLFPMICELASQEGWKVYLFGAMPGIAQETQSKLESLFPPLSIVGASSPPKKFDINSPDAMDIIAKIIKVDPDILFVALGPPKQEEFIFKYKDQLKVPLTIGVGGAFDFFVGHKKRAPKWLQNLGLEWAHRLFQEPKRLWWRYLMRDSLCPLLICLEIFQNSIFSKFKK
ncbi:MAG: WecB/TagA/CpsF family glycosyltransferase [Nitrospira sp.]|nr:WecB/TagA/CpsF family glycosyltransferase [Nitrospira sp.]